MSQLNGERVAPADPAVCTAIGFAPFAFDANSMPSSPRRRRHQGRLFL